VARRRDSGGFGPESLLRDVQGVKDVNQRNPFGDTPLHVVCRWGDAEAAETLIRAGADVNAQGEYAMTPLFEAISVKLPQIVQMLLDAGADPLAKTKNYRPDHTVLEYAQIGKPSPTSDRIIELLETAIAK
jgi:ankyrin repeat protein